MARDWSGGLETCQEVAAELLAEHAWSPEAGACLGCAWAPTACDLEERRRQHCEHQADVLAAGDLLARAE